MSFWDTQAFKISAVVVLGLILFALIIIIIGYCLAGNLINNFEDEVKNVSETERFQDHLSKIINTNIAFFWIVKGAQIVWIVDPKDNVIKIKNKKENLRNGKKIKSLQIDLNITEETLDRANKSFRLFEFDASRFSKILQNFGFLVKFGLMFIKNHPVKEIHAAAKMFDKELNKDSRDNQTKMVILENLDFKNITIYKLRRTEDSEYDFEGAVTYLTFEPFQINDKVCVISDFITYILEKVYKDKNETNYHIQDQC
ncbi:hypothetical protein CWI37_0088p0020 [Hamiltosporidium tvaerminnensis]|uniref:Uncharacterized protein n=1 Tax=Hamiltosporidium tvaerminnensis TaxID=1176355 RepID=A0A4Q9KWR0_9MICR|nr:hypothetical protein LUQ84_001012 [Hamiltosporidium tvaerminnensis]TBT99387.1 hypothetical protein CWI37_1362p0010 [Hamiltosporidium tvaerminnensis]TBU04789.1 hypothetical protein CWI37_0088p0020 [Hamiltosporidium tvaerminnensis]